MTRDEADVISNIDGRPVYGGTPSDGSIIEALDAVANLGKKVNFYPFLLMEVLPGNALPNPWDEAGVGQSVFPWRGRITTEKAFGVTGSTDVGGGAAATRGAERLPRVRPTVLLPMPTGCARSRRTRHPPQHDRRAGGHRTG